MSSNTSSQSIGKNMIKIKDSIVGIGEDVKDDVVGVVEDAKDDVVGVVEDIKDKVVDVGKDVGNVTKSIGKVAKSVEQFAENPVESIEKIIKALEQVPTVLEQIIVDPKFLKQVKVVSLILAQALSESVQVVTPYMIETYSELVGKLARYGFLAIFDAIGVVPVAGEIVEIILLIQDAVMSILSVARVSTQVTKITAMLISNMITIYQKNAKEVEAAHGRITYSKNQFQNTNSPETTTITQSQSAGKKKKHKRKSTLKNRIKK
jgi:hypothetical protein